jgi:hypothetical protein
MSIVETNLLKVGDAVGHATRDSTRDRPSRPSDAEIDEMLKSLEDLVAADEIESTARYPEEIADHLARALLLAKKLDDVLLVLLIDSALVRVRT